MGNTPNFNKIRRKTIHNRDQSLEKYIPIFENILKNYNITPERIDYITRLKLEELVNQLNKQAVTSEQLLAIYGLRAATIGRKNCIITQDYFSYALEKARECDTERSKTGKRNMKIEDDWDLDSFFPPLYGIPISVKDNIPVQGLVCTNGITVRAEKVISQDSGMVTCMKNSGLIPFVKTNLPQLTFNFDSVNYLWGRTLNPWNPKKSAGGSSGGQGAAVAARISPIGLGNDQAGSIRIPAQFNGVYGLMPSPDRLPTNGEISWLSKGFQGMDTTRGVNGPLSTSIQALALLFKTMTNETFYQGKTDPYKKMIPFDTKAYKAASEGKQKYRIGYFEGFSMIEPTAANKRALAEVVQFLRKQGHQLVRVQMPNEQQLIFSLFQEITSEGGMQSFVQQLKGQQLIEEYKQIKFFVDRGDLSFRILQTLISVIYPRLGKVVEACKKKTLHEYLVHVGRTQQLKNEWTNYWKKQKFDFVVSPGFGTQALNHGASKDGSLIAAYTYIYNILGMVSVAQPITTTKANQLLYESRWNDLVTTLIQTSLLDSQGLPVGIQLIGLPFTQQKVLGLSRVIEKEFKFYEKNPLPPVT